MKRPTTISEPHAVDRLIERHAPDLLYTEAHTMLMGIMARCRFVSYDPSDLNGLGQAIWVDDYTGISIAVDSKGLTRTVLP